MSLPFLSQLPPVVVEILHLSVWLALLVVIFVPLEHMFAAKPKEIFRKGWGTDLAYYFISSLAPAVILSLPIGLLAWTVHRFVPEGLLATTASWPLPVRALAGMVAGEIGFYWGHRWSHEIPFLWRFHSIHHSAEHLDFLVNTRAHPIDMVFGRFCGLVPIFLLGLGGPIGAKDSIVPLFVAFVGTLWGFLIHANLKWRFGPLEWLIASPAFHHWHHTLDGPIDRNYAANLPWIDRLFGTLHLPAEWPEAYGIQKKIPETLTDQLLYPLVPDAPLAEKSPSPSPTTAVE